MHWPPFKPKEFMHKKKLIKFLKKANKCGLLFAKNDSKMYKSIKTTVFKYSHSVTPCGLIMPLIMDTE